MNSLSDVTLFCNKKVLHEKVLALNVLFEDLFMVERHMQDKRMLHDKIVSIKKHLLFQIRHYFIMIIVIYKTKKTIQFYMVSIVKLVPILHGLYC